jgi:hypothetical protein
MYFHCNSKDSIKYSLSKIDGIIQNIKGNTSDKITLLVETLNSFNEDEYLVLQHCFKNLDREVELALDGQTKHILTPASKKCLAKIIYSSTYINALDFSKANLFFSNFSRDDHDVETVFSVIDKEDVMLFEAIAANKNIEALRFNGNSRIAETSFHGFNYKSSGIYLAMFALMQNPSITRIELANCGITSKSIEYILPALAKTSVRHINLSNNLLDDTAISLLSENLPANKHLLKMDLYGNKIDYNCKNVKKLQQLSQIEVVVRQGGAKNVMILPKKVPDIIYKYFLRQSHHVGINGKGLSQPTKINSANDKSAKITDKSKNVVNIVHHLQDVIPKILNLIDTKIVMCNFFSTTMQQLTLDQIIIRLKQMETLMDAWQKYDLNDLILPIEKQKPFLRLQIMKERLEQKQWRLNDFFGSIKAYIMDVLCKSIDDDSKSKWLIEQKQKWCLEHQVLEELEKVIKEFVTDIRFTTTSSLSLVALPEKEIVDKKLLRAFNAMQKMMSDQGIELLDINDNGSLCNC